MKKGKKGKPAPEPYQPTTTSDGYLLWDIRLIQPNPQQPRKYFDPEKLEALKKSIRHEGILTPLRIAPINIEGQAKLVDGERRFRAATELGLTHVPVILSPTSKDQRRLFKESVIANFCREDMTEIEIARALEKLIKDNGYTQAEVAEIVGKTQAWVSNMLKFLKLHPQVADDLTKRTISPVMAMAVSRFPSDKQPALAAELKKAKEEKGGPLRHEEIALVVAQAAAKGKTAPIKPKKGRPPEMDPLVLRVRTLNGRLENIRPELEEFAEVSEKDLGTLPGEHLISLEQHLRSVVNFANTILEKLRVAL